MRDWELEREAKARVADHYTAAELMELLDIPVEDLVEEYWEKILENEVICGQLSLTG
jgi:hypothetical protein